MTRPTRPRTPPLYHGASPEGAPEHEEPAHSRAIEPEGSGSCVARPGAVAATWLLLGCVLTFYFTALAQRPGLAQLVIAQLALGAAAIAAAAFTTAPRSLSAVCQTLGLVAPSPRAALGALLVGGSAWYSNLQLTLWVQSLTGGSTRVVNLEQLVAGPSLLLVVLCISLFPALGEELAFRGLWARALAARLGVARAALLTAPVFGAYHLSSAQMLPATILGVILAWASLRGGSLWLAMALHAANNATAILAARGQLGGLGAAMSAHPMLALVIALAITLGGLALLATSPRTRAPSR